MTLVQHRRHVWAECRPSVTGSVTDPEINVFYVVGSKNADIIKRRKGVGEWGNPKPDFL
jgi:hypothetical protein